MPAAAAALVQLLGVLGRAVFDVAVAVPVEQVLVGAEQERAGAARGVEDAELGCLVAGVLPSSSLPTVFLTM